MASSPWRTRRCTRARCSAAMKPGEAVMCATGSVPRAQSDRASFASASRTRAASAGSLSSFLGSFTATSGTARLVHADDAGAHAAVVEPVADELVVGEAREVVADAEPHVLLAHRLRRRGRLAKQHRDDDPESVQGTHANLLGLAKDDTLPRARPAP